MTSSCLVSQHFRSLHYILLHQRFLGTFWIPAGLPLTLSFASCILSPPTSPCLCGVSGDEGGVPAGAHHPIIFTDANRERQPVNKTTL